jgi:hypothetical protein
MLPKTLLHKRNGHARPPRKDLSPGDMLRLVHGAHAETPRLTSDLMRFVHLVRTEKAAALLAEAAREVDGLQSALGVALAETEAAFARGEIADVRSLLDAFRHEADAVTRTVTKLVATAFARASERQVVDLNDVVARVVGLLHYRLGDQVSIRHRAEPALPPVAANPVELERMLLAIAGTIAATEPGAPSAATLTIDTVRVPGALRGEDGVRIRILVTGAEVDERAAEALAQATEIARDHGGVLMVAPLADGSRRFTVDLPGV